VSCETASSSSASSFTGVVNGVANVVGDVMKDWAWMLGDAASTPVAMGDGGEKLTSVAACGIVSAACRGVLAVAGVIP